MSAQCTKRQYFALLFTTCLTFTAFNLALWSKRLYFINAQNNLLTHTASHTFRLRKFNRPIHDTYTNNMNVTYVSATGQLKTPYTAWSKGVVTKITPSLQQNCSKLLNADDAEIERVTELLHGSNMFYIDANFSNCDEIVGEFYSNFYVSETEKTFPIAFALVVHTNIQQVLRFLKAIYRCHNLYCIHPDPSSGEEFIETLKLISHCLPNVFITSEVHDVLYETPSTIFEAQISCFRELEIHPYTEWQYVINLCSLELPLQTNRYIVENLRNMDGVSIVHISNSRGFMLKKLFSHRENIKHLNNNEYLFTPLRLKLHKSKAYNALSRSFVHHILHNHTMQQLHNWLVENCMTPEEFFYATAFMNPGAPGGYYWSQSMPTRERSIHIKLVEVRWKHSRNNVEYIPGEACLGKTVHEVCIMNSAELPRVNRAMKSGCWFFNNYFMEDDHVVMDCVEEELVRNNRQEYVHDHWI